MKKEKFGIKLGREAVENRPATKVAINGLLNKLRTTGISNLDKNFKFEKVIEVISAIDTLVLAYELIKSKKGVDTKANTEETLDKIDSIWFSNMSKQLSAGKFKFSSVRRILIPKPNDKSSSRPLGMSSPREKVIQKAIQLVLEAIYEPLFSKHSHGCRPSLGNHTALKSVKTNFQASNWVVEADLTKCFDRIDHHILLNILKKKINCEKTVALIKSSIRCGYVLENTKYDTKIGIPQGSVMSPTLCNIYLNELDSYLAKLSVDFDEGGKKRPYSLELRRLRYKLNVEKKKGSDEKILKQLNKEIEACPRTDNTGYKKMRFVRYVDDFVIGIAGEYADAVKIVDSLKTFLENELKLELNLTKTKITKFSSNKVYFLGTYIRGGYRKEKKIVTTIRCGKKLVARTTPRVSFHAPIEKLFEKLLVKKFIRKKNNRMVPTAVRSLVNFDHADILRFFNQKIRGCLNYYSFVDNHKSLGSIVHTLKLSCARTLALKLKERAIRPIFKKFGSYLECPETGLKIYVPSTFKRKQEFKTNERTPFEILTATWQGKRTRTNLDKPCCICGTMEKVEMHHIKAVRDLKTKYQSGKLEFFKMQMIAINRKQLPLCQAHHVAVHKNTLTEKDRSNMAEYVKNHFKKNNSNY